MDTICIACGTKLIYAFKKNGWGFRRCPKCQLTSLLFDHEYESFISNFYDEGYFNGDPECAAYVHYEADKPNVIRNAKIQFAPLKKYKLHGKLLDVGCAMGFVVEYARSIGYDAYGFDPSKYAIDHVPPTLSKKITLGSINTVSYAPKSFDVITAYDVMEHTNDPIESMKKLGSFLKDDGIIEIATGDTGSFIARLMGKKWNFYSPPQHLYFFNRNNLSLLLNKAGFKPVYWFSIGKWLSLAYLLHLAGINSEIPLAEKISQQVASYWIGKIPLFIPMFDNMTVLAVKK